MPYYNKIILMGHLGRDIEVKESQAGKHWTQFSMSTQRKQWKEAAEKITDWHNVIAFGYTAKNLEGLKKGSVVWVEGELTQSEYEKDGVIHKTSRILANIVVKVDARKPDKKPETDIFSEAPF